MSRNFRRHVRRNFTEIMAGNFFLKKTEKKSLLAEFSADSYEAFGNCVSCYTKYDLNISIQNFYNLLFSQGNFKRFLMFVGFKKCISVFPCACKAIEQLLYKFLHASIQIIQMPHNSFHVGKCFMVCAKCMICLVLKQQLLNHPSVYPEIIFGKCSLPHTTAAS